MAKQICDFVPENEKQLYGTTNTLAEKHTYLHTACVQYLTKKFVLSAKDYDSQKIWNFPPSHRATGGNSVCNRTWHGGQMWLESGCRPENGNNLVSGNLGKVILPRTPPAPQFLEAYAEWFMWWCLWDVRKLETFSCPEGAIRIMWPPWCVFHYW